MIRIYISGVNTEIGKTAFSALLAKHFLEQGKTVTYVKPVQTGSPPDDDSAYVREHSGLGMDRAYCLLTGKEPAAPMFVFEQFPFYGLVEKINAVQDTDVLLVESAGGLLVPLCRRWMNHDIARKCGLDVALVVPNRLGCINDALLNIHYLKTTGLNLYGLAMNEHFADDPMPAERNRDYLAEVEPGCIRYVFGNGWLNAVGADKD
ncbi:MAG: dethiobiotin synthase [Desulfovibrio sp.]|uniref:dethiobiotin synthase n=1 Tax=Desulfovibrio sp. 7SRBS1 TaxID=3378064 RepID=UPI003B3CEB74